MKKTESATSFQKDFQDLEKIVEKFEKGEMDLDESLEEFEHGLTLAANCKKRLAVIENRVIEIKKKFATLAKEPLETEQAQDTTTNELPF